ncbi:hypothetical protein T11_16755 [Trichinella zimbabwensis]|uniref:Uncharacterized protein n=1 Tax=Trichinella zimbabwensis TaxID=268475 RepID=A0A0V1I150_9BILA|nr:hypothetical protein T11_16755 [Trichinella zimbabwensis]
MDVPEMISCNQEILHERKRKERQSTLDSFTTKKFKVEESKWNSDYLITDYQNTRLSELILASWLKCIYFTNTATFCCLLIFISGMSTPRKRKSCKEKVTLLCCANARDSDRLQLLLVGKL